MQEDERVLFQPFHSKRYIVEDGITMIKPKIQYIAGQIRISDHVSRKNKHF